MRPNILWIFSPSVLAVLVLSGCGKSPEELRAQERALDSNPTMLASCAYETITSIRISTLSGQDTAAICEKIANTTGENPSVKLLRGLSKAVSTLQQIGRSDDMIGDAYQLMRIAQSRGQLKNDDAMIATFNVVFKIVNGTEGRVKPKDLNILLSQLGQGATKMSDQGLINSASALSVMKQDQGE